MVRTGFCPARLCLWITLQPLLGLTLKALIRRLKLPPVPCCTAHGTPRAMLAQALQIYLYIHTYIHLHYMSVWFLCYTNEVRLRPPHPPGGPNRPIGVQNCENFRLLGRPRCAKILPGWVTKRSFVVANTTLTPSKGRPWLLPSPALPLDHAVALPGAYLKNSN